MEKEAQIDMVLFGDACIHRSTNLKTAEYTSKRICISFYAKSPQENANNVPFAHAHWLEGYLSQSTMYASAI